MNNILLPFLITFFAGISTVLGALIIFVKPKNISNFIGFSLSFSGSIMLFISIFELIPEGFFGINREYNIILASILLILMLFLGNLIVKSINRVIYINNKKHNSLYKVGILSMFGLMLHNMPEGVLTFLSSTINIKLGLKLSIAIMLHNIPEGIAIAVPIYYSKEKGSKAIFYTLLSGFSEVAGALVAYLFLYKYISTMLISIILLFVSGIMISISFNEIFKETDKYPKRMVILGCLLGLIITILTEFVL